MKSKCPYWGNDPYLAPVRRSQPYCTPASATPAPWPTLCTTWSGVSQVMAHSCARPQQPTLDFLAVTFCVRQKVVVYGDLTVGLFAAPTGAARRRLCHLHSERFAFFVPIGPYWVTLALTKLLTKKRCSSLMGPAIGHPFLSGGLDRHTLSHVLASPLSSERPWAGQCPRSGVADSTRHCLLPWTFCLSTFIVRQKGIYVGCW